MQLLQYGEIARAMWFLPNELIISVYIRKQDNKYINTMDTQHLSISMYKNIATLVFYFFIIISYSFLGSCVFPAIKLLKIRSLKNF